MSSVTTGGHLALISSAMGAVAGASVSPRRSHDAPCTSSEILRLWRSDLPPGAARSHSDNPPAVARVGESHRMHDLIEAEVIPRLLMAHQQCMRERPNVVSFHGGIEASQVETLSLLLIAVDERGANDFVDALLHQGHGEDVVFLELFAPAARRLGHMWELDTLSFSDVTIGLLRLHGMLRKLSAHKEIPGYPQRPDMRILLSAWPGETHIFGVRMVAEFFRHAGWVVNDDLQLSAAALTRRVASEWFAVIGLSMGSDVHVGDITALVADVRSASCNRHVGVMVGGDLFNRRPALAGDVGADLTANDGLAALAEAERWCEAVAVPYSMHST